LPDTVGIEGIGQIAFFRDPDGNVQALMAEVPVRQSAAAAS
jgi:hypothetical protein